MLGSKQNFLTKARFFSDDCSRGSINLAILIPKTATKWITKAINHVLMKQKFCLIDVDRDRRYLYHQQLDRSWTVLVMVYGHEDDNILTDLKYAHEIFVVIEDQKLHEPVHLLRQVNQTPKNFVFNQKIIPFQEKDQLKLDYHELDAETLDTNTQMLFNKLSNLQKFDLCFEAAKMREPKDDEERSSFQTTILLWTALITDKTHKYIHCCFGMDGLLLKDTAMKSIQSLTEVDIAILHICEGPEQTTEVYAACTTFAMWHLSQTLNNKLKALRYVKEISVSEVRSRKNEKPQLLQTHSQCMSSQLINEYIEECNKEWEDLLVEMEEDGVPEEPMEFAFVWNRC